MPCSAPCLRSIATTLNKVCFNGVTVGERNHLTGRWEFLGARGERAGRAFSAAWNYEVPDAFSSCVATVRYASDGCAAFIILHVRHDINATERSHRASKVN
jgi:hypothetical protein